MKKLKKARKKTKKGLDKVLSKTAEIAKKRGRHGINVNFVAGRAHNYGLLLSPYWDAVKAPLLKAKTKEGVESALQEIHETQRPQFTVFSALILKTLREKKFPKTDNAQIKFLAESLGGQGRISPRRARDICTAERSKVTYQIIRQEYFIECTCRYKGPAKNGGCPKCGTTEIAINAGPPRHGFLR